MNFQPSQKQGKQFNILSSCKGPGTELSDAIPAKVYKAGGLPKKKTTDRVVSMHVEEGGYHTRLKGCFHNAPIHTERNPQVCDNHRGISLLSIAGKIQAKILFNLLNAHLDQDGLIPESQCGFRTERGTVDMIFTARQLQEKCQEQNVDLYMTLVFLTKAFDSQS